MPNFTPEDLLLYQAGETDKQTSEAISKELTVNWSLREKLNVIAEAGNRLSAMKLQSPCKQTVQNILGYAMHKPVVV